MTLPANIRINVKTPFPALVSGVGGISVTKLNGQWTISLAYQSLSPLLSSGDLVSSLIAIYDPITQQYNQISVSEIISASTSVYRIYPSAGPVVVAPTDITILLNSNTPAPANISLPQSASRLGVPITIKDYAGQAGVGTPYTFVPASGETIDGFSAAASAANGSALINIAYGKKTLFPLTSGGWYL